MDTDMTKKEAEEIRLVVRAGGWDAVRANSRLNAIWQKELEGQRKYERDIQDT